MAGTPRLARLRGRKLFLWGRPPAAGTGRSGRAGQGLAYARHYLVTRTDQLVTYLSYAFLTTKKDTEAKDFTRTSDLLAIQLRKNAKVFS